MLALDQLRVIRAIAEYGSIAAASRALHLSQPTVSYHVASLERVVGGPLVVRSPRGSRLSELGELACEHAELILDHLAAATEELSTFVSHGTSRAAIGTFPSAGATLVAPALAALARSGASYRLVVAETGEVDERLRERQLHVGMLFTEPGLPPRFEDDIQSQPLVDDPLVVLLPSTHPDARSPEVDLRNLAGETWISAASDEDSGHQLLLRAFREANLQLRMGPRLDDLAVTGALVAAGLGVAVVPSLALTQLGGMVAARPVTDARFRRHIHIAWQKRPYRPAVESFVQAVREHASKLPGFLSAELTGLR
jgi:molybdate transport repressor ModE-like protein